MAVVSAAAALDPNAAPRFAQSTVTFTGASGLGLHGTATTLFTVAGGAVLVRYLVGRCTTNCTGATATLTLGITGSASLFIGTTTATGLVTTAELFISATPTAAGLALPAAMKDIVIDANVILSSTHVSADVTAGVLVFDIIWEPITLGATLV